MTFRYQHGDRPLEGYTILRGIGRGGFGEVYYAMSDGGREVALKVVQQNHDVELRGINHCINLKSPYLVSIFDVKTTPDGSPFVIMEYVAGPSLRDLVRAAPQGLGAQKAAFLVHEIAKGLKYLHERGIVHRDLKPENIFFEDGYVKIGDYGLSKYISMSRQSGQTISVGTVHYMAPEIGSGNYHHGIDIYALGVMFFELLTGDVPFNGDSMGEILMKHLTCEPDLSRIPETFRPVIARALEKSPAQRTADTGQFLADLLEAGDTARMIAAFDPTSLSTRTIRTDEHGAERGAASPAPQGREVGAGPAIGGRPFPAPGAGAGARRPQQAPPGAPASPERTAPREARRPARAGGGPASDRGLDSRLGQALLTVIAMAFAMTLFSGGRWSYLWSYALLMGGCTLAVSFVQLWWVPRFQIPPGIGRRLVVFGHGIPLVIIMSAFPGADVRLHYAIMAGLLIVDWDLRTRENRREQVSFHLAFTAAVVGLLATAIFGGRGAHPLLGAACLAGVSLAVSAFAPYAPSARARRRTPGEPAHAGAPGETTPGIPSPAGIGEAAGAFAAAFDVDGGSPAMDLSDGTPEDAAVRRSSTLTRPRADRMIGGVCSGIALRYGWEVVWLRAAFLLTTLLGFGSGLLVYLVLWICMPEEPRATVREVSRGSRVSAPRVLAKVAFGVAAAVLVMLAFVAAFVHPLPFGWRIRAMEHLVGGLLFGVPGFLFSVLTVAIRSRPGAAAEELRRSASKGGGGWSALGGLLFAVGLVPLGASALVTARILGPDPGGGRALTGFEQMLAALGRPELAIVLSLAVFLASLFCTLAGRRAGGPGHVVRGALGWLLAVGVIVVLFLVLPRIVTNGEPGAPRAVPVLPEGTIVLPEGDTAPPHPPGPVAHQGGLLERGSVAADKGIILVALTLVLGVMSAVFIAWPGRADGPRGRGGDSFEVTEDERMEPAKR